MEKKKNSCENDCNIVYHIKVLYGVGLFLFIVLMLEILIFSKQLYSQQLQMSGIALAQTLLSNSSSNYQNDFRTADLEFLYSDLSKFRLKRNENAQGNRHYLQYHVSRIYILSCKVLLAW